MIQQVTNVSKALQNNLAKIYNARNDIYDNDNNENMFIIMYLHIYKIQDARYKYTENKHQTLFFLW